MHLPESRVGKQSVSFLCSLRREPSQHLSSWITPGGYRLPLPNSSNWNYLLWWMTMTNCIWHVVKDMNYLRPWSLNWTLEVSIIYMWKKREKMKIWLSERAGYGRHVNVRQYAYSPPFFWRRRTTFPSVLCGLVWPVIKFQLIECEQKWSTAHTISCSRGLWDPKRKKTTGHRPNPV